MSIVRELVLEWTSINSPGGVSVLHFGGITPMEDIQIGLKAWAAANFNLIPPTTSMRVPGEGREFDDTTGTLTGVWSGTESGTQAGNQPAQSVPNSTQALMRFTTGAVVAGRLLKGRMFIPGLRNDLIVNGELQEAARLQLAATWRDNIGDLEAQVIWSRPFAGSTTPTVRPARAGSSSTVTEVSVWSEFAVQRGRR